MIRLRTATTRWAMLAPWLIVAALLLRIAVPAGWMPAVTGFGIMPCAGTGPMQLGRSMNGHHHQGSNRDEKQAQPCAFAPFAAALTAPPPPLMPAAPMPLATPELRRASFAVAIGHGLAAPPPPATGPPLLLRS